MLQIESPSAETTRLLGEAIGGLLRAGDLVLLHGDLGAGKTTFTQGIAQGMGVTGRVMSPTFIVARIHDPRGEGPSLVHVDAYRIEDDLDLEILDLDSSLESAVTVVEWGAGKAEMLSESRLEIELVIASGTGGDWSENLEEPRTVLLRPVGEQWNDRLEAEFVPALENLDFEGEDHAGTVY